MSNCVGSKSRRGAAAYVLFDDLLGAGEEGLREFPDAPAQEDGKLALAPRLSAVPELRLDLFQRSSGRDANRAMPAYLGRFFRERQSVIARRVTLSACGDVYATRPRLRAFLKRALMR